MIEIKDQEPETVKVELPAERWIAPKPTYKVGTTTVKSVWHRAIGRKRVAVPLREDKSDPIKITGYRHETKTKNNHPSLKKWAAAQIETKTEYADICKKWFENKSQ